MVKDSLDREGFVVLEQFLNEQQVAKSLELWDVLAADPKVSKFFDDENDLSTLKALHHIDRHQAFFKDIFHATDLLKLLGELASEPMSVVYAETFRKAPRSGGPTPPHQDMPYFMRDCNARTDDPVFAIWVALDRVDEGNGCLRYVRGSHRKGIRDYSKTEVLGFSLGMTDYGPEDEALAAPICLNPGDAIIHHALTIHRTDTNESDRERRALVCNYISKNLADRQA